MKNTIVALDTLYGTNLLNQKTSKALLYHETEEKRKTEHMVSTDFVIKAIENGAIFYVQNQVVRAVQGRQGKYLSTVADREKGNNLSALPTIAEFKEKNGRP